MFEISSHFYFNKGLKIFLEEDFIRYYLWHLYRSPCETLGQTLPMHRAHISVTLPRIYGEKIVQESKKYSGQKVDMWYNGYIQKGGRAIYNNKRHINYWIKFDIPRAEQIKEELGIIEDNFLGFHCTIANNKSFIKNG